MSANLATDAAGNVSFASLKKAGWHNQGTVFQEEVSGLEMLKHARLDFEVQKVPVRYDFQRNTGVMAVTGWDTTTDKEVLTPVYEKEERTVPNSNVVIRSDDGRALGQVSDGYEIFQNREIIGFFEGLVGDHKIVYETAGALGDGEKVWVMAHIPDLDCNVKGDEVRPYLNIVNGHGGNATLSCYPTAVRVVCANTMRMADQGFSQARKKHGANTVHAGYQIKHTKNMLKAVERVQGAYMMCLKDFQNTTDIMRLLANTQITEAIKQKYWQMIIGGKDESTEVLKIKSNRAQTMLNNRVDVLERLLVSPTNQTEATKGTAYGLFQTVVEYIDHERATRITEEGVTDDTARFASAMFGSGEGLKAISLKAIMDLVAV